MLVLRVICIYEVRLLDDLRWHCIRTYRNSIKIDLGVQKLLGETYTDNEMIL
jgi:hypothetical protein